MRVLAPVMRVFAHKGMRWWILHVGLIIVINGGGGDIEGCSGRLIHTLQGVAFHNDMAMRKKRRYKSFGRT